MNRRNPALNTTTRRTSSAEAVCARSATRVTAPSASRSSVAIVPSITKATGRRRNARPRQHQRHGAGEPETATDQHAGRDHAARQIIEPGPAMDPRALASERPQEGRREQERGNVEGGEEPLSAGRCWR